MKIDLVIAHYNENITWVDQYIDHELINNIFVYHKNIVTEHRIKHFKLENIGRESHTYLHHVINNYDYLKGNSDNFTIFFQGQPHFNLNSFNEYLYHIKNNNLNFVDTYKVDSPFAFMDNGRRPIWQGTTNPSKYDIQDWCKIYLNKYIDESTRIPIFWGACFGVRNNLILLSDVNVYERMLTPELKTINPEEGHYFERLWFYVFNMDKSNQKIS